FGAEVIFERDGHAGQRLVFDRGSNLGVHRGGDLHRAVAVDGQVSVQPLVVLLDLVERGAGDLAGRGLARCVKFVNLFDGQFQSDDSGWWSVVGGWLSVVG